MQVDVADRAIGDVISLFTNSAVSKRCDAQDTMSRIEVNAIQRSTADTSQEIDEEDNAKRHFVDLTRLPPELRNLIYEMVLLRSTPIRIRTWRRDFVGRQAPLLKTCRQIRNEALPIFYQSNTFRFISDGRAAQMCRLSFHVIDAHISKMQQIEIGCRNCESYISLRIDGKVMRTLRGSSDDKATFRHLDKCSIARSDHLRAGQEYLLAEDASGRGHVLDAANLERLIERIECPRSPIPEVKQSLSAYCDYIP